MADNILEQITTAGYQITDPAQPNYAGRYKVAKLLGVSKDQAYRILRRLRKGNMAVGSNTATVKVEEHRLKSENRELRQLLEEALGKQVCDQRYQQFVAEVASAPRRIPEWVKSTRSGSPKQGMPVAHLSDAHLDEVVDPRQVNFVNAYDREIAEKRLRRFFEKTISLCQDYLKGMQYPGIVLPISGDMFSGSIHEELRETNEAPLCESLRYWLDPMYAGIKMFAEHFGQVFVPVVVGNHPRSSPKPRAKGGVRENFDWLLASLLQRDFARVGDKRVTFHVSDSFDFYFRIYGTRFLQTHGDQFRGGSGIAAELSPMMIGDARKRERQQAINEPYDAMIMGHWHRRILLERIKGNGSLKGFDEFAYKMNFKFQEPVQSFWIVAPEHGITFEAPIFVKAENEGWEKDASAIPVFEAA